MTGTPENLIDQLLFGQSTLARGVQAGLRGGAKLVRGIRTGVRTLSRRVRVANLARKITRERKYAK